MATLRDLVEQTIAELRQYSTVRESSGTFKEWVLDDALDIVGVKLGDVGLLGDMSNMLVELDTGELIHVSRYSADTETATCPPWFRGQMGSPANDTVAVNTRVAVNPIWTRYGVAQKVVEGIQAISEDLFATDEVDLTTLPLASNYELPSDVEGILSVTVQDVSPTESHMPIQNWSLDTLNSDGERYLRVRPLGMSNLTMRVTYRKAAVVPEPSDFAATWASTGLPASAQDLPVLYAKMLLVLAPDAAKTQQVGVEQGERGRMLQSWSSASTSRRWQEIYAQRLRDERRKLLDRFPVKPHKVVS